MNKKPTCCICVDNNTLDFEPNSILSCSSCNIQVHVFCYGLEKKPAKFTCDVCKSSAEATKPSCIFCPDEGGAFKKFKNGLWTHVICAVFLSGVGFNSSNEPRIKTEEVGIFSHEENPDYCDICKKQGSSQICQSSNTTPSKSKQDSSSKKSTFTHISLIKCMFKNCYKNMHVTCGQKMGLLFEQFGNNPCSFSCLCNDHHPLSPSNSYLPEKRGNSISTIASSNLTTTGAKRIKNDSNAVGESSINITDQHVDVENEGESFGLSVTQFLNSENEAMKKFLVSKINGNVEGLSHLTPAIEAASETNKSLLNQLKSLENEMQELESAKKEKAGLKKNYKRQLEDSKIITDRITTSLLLMFNVLKPETISGMSFNDMDSFSKKVSDILKNNKDKLQGTEKDTFLQKVVSDALKVHKSSTTNKIKQEPDS